MNRFTLTICFLFLSLILFVFDKSVYGYFEVFNYFSATITFLIILINIKKPLGTLVIFFTFGLLCDWFNRSFIGIYSLVSVIVAYIYTLMKLKIAGNKIALGGFNFITAYILYLTLFDFKNIFSLNALLGAAITTIISSIVWLRVK